MRVVTWLPGDDVEAAAVTAWCAEKGVARVDLEGVPPSGDIVWIHAGSRVPELPSAVHEVLVRHLAQGGVVGLTLLATPLAQALGVEGPPPTLVPPERWAHAADPRWPEGFRDWPDYPHVRGVQGYGAHPLLAGMAGGCFSWKAREGDLVGGTEYRRPAWPPGVIGVDRSYVHLDAQVAVAWEARVGRGEVRCIGAHVCLTTGDQLLAPHRDLLLRNFLGRWEGTRTWWPSAEARHARVVPVPAPHPLAPFPEDMGGNPVARPDPGSSDAFTLGGPAGLLTGNARDGLSEAWLHPLCVLDEGLQWSTTDGEPVVQRAEVCGTHVRRWLKDSGGGTWRETMALDATSPAWAWEVTPEGTTTATVGIELRLAMRLAWPMPATLLHPVRLERREKDGAVSLLASGADDRHRVLVIVDGAAPSEVSVVPPDPRAPDESPRLRIVGQPGRGVRLSMGAVAGGPGLPSPAPADVAAGQRRRLADIMARGPRWHDAHRRFDEAFAWARVRLANFMSSTLGGRRGLMAGYARTRPGWNHSRPGYAWFFGRDTCWCVDALLALGLFEEARVAIGLLAECLDVTGKVPHEVSASGVVHYDAADATPLFVRAVANYFAWTGDRETVSVWWPAVRRAVAHVAACDRDGDGLPENTGEGHGWIEMGSLGGGHVTSYVAACWIDALRRLVPVAAWFDPAWRAELEARERRATASQSRLRLPDGGLALHMDAEGRLEAELTALAAVPIALGVDDSSLRVATMEHLAAPRFQAPWGLRMLPTDSPRYRPRAYHAGAVWPLFTGWAALADTRVGEPARAVERLSTIARLVDARNRGAFDEVLDGDTGEAGGVCSDQAWSAAALITPLLHGILGLAPDAARGRCELRAELPPSLGWVDVMGLRTGESRWEGSWLAEGLRLRHLAGPPLDVHLVDRGTTLRLDSGSSREVLVPRPRESA